MQKSARITLAFFTALGSILLISPRSTKARDRATTPEPATPVNSLASYFESTWGYLEHGIKASHTNATILPGHSAR